MTPELIGILSVGGALFIGLAGLQLTLYRGLRVDMADLRVEVRAELREVRADVRSLDTRVSAVEQQVARLTGAVEVLAGLGNGRIARTGDPGSVKTTQESQTGDLA